MTSSTRRIALVQQRAGDDAEGNVVRALEALGEAAARGAELVCLQELFRTRYFPQAEDAASFDLAETIPGPTTERLAKRAEELGVVVIAPVFERRAAGLYHNSAAVIDADGTLVGVVRKMHIPDDPLFYEKFYFAPGDAGSEGGGFAALDTRAGRIGVGICWDQWFPESARLMALDGAQILFYPSAIARSDGESDAELATQRDAWVTLQRGHAIANGLFVAAVNRVGREGALDFWGHSFVCDPQGRVLERASGDAEALVVADCRLGEIEEQRRAWPFLRDRRIDAYADLSRRYRS
jgi:N-carbamoylputrescine amidase